MILVIGDLIVDKYVYGTSSRLSQEAPVPIVNYERAEYRLGGAGNVAANIKSLDGTVFLASMAGEDDAKRWAVRELQEKGIEQLTLTDGDRPTTKKTRLIANGQQIARFDRENTANIDSSTAAEYFAQIIKPDAPPDAVIISDYAKGFITQYSLEYLKNALKPLKKPVFLDPKAAHTSIYKSLNWIGDITTPNLHEAEAISGIKIHDQRTLEQAGRYIINRFGCKYVLITRGEHGMTLFSEHKMLDYPSKARDVFDVSGAGDTVIAVLAYVYSLGHPIESAVGIANDAAGIVVGKRGTATVSRKELGLTLPALDLARPSAGLE